MVAYLHKINKNQQWRVLYGEPGEDSRMLDLELILRYYTLNSTEIYNSDKQKISLKQELNKYMQSKMNASPDFITEKELEFNSVINFIFYTYGRRSFL